MSDARTPITSRYDFVYFFDITDGNPNGDPDAGNLPRIDPETGQGLVTDVCLKRKIRNYVGLSKSETPPYEIYVKEKAVLNHQQARAYKALDIDPKKHNEKSKGKEDGKAKGKGKDEDKVEKDRQLTRWMCKNFFDIRAFGAVMSSKEMNCGQVRGPIQFGLARSLHPVVTAEFTITRCAVTKEDDEEKERTMGRKFTVPYGLYRVHGYVNANLAAGPNGTGFSQEDLDLLKLALDQMFECDRSAARANMRPVACIAFKHESALGNARSDRLFSRVRCTPAPGVQPLAGSPGGLEEGRPPRSFADYVLTVDEKDMPKGVTFERWVDWD